MKRFLILSTLLLSLIWQLAGIGMSPAEETGEIELKAAYLVKMVDFITWPSGSNIKDKDKPFIIGIIGDENKEGFLRTAYNGQKIAKFSKSINVLFITKLDEILNCNLLFITETGKIDVTKVFDMIKNRPILTVSDARGMIQKGCHIRMFIRRQKIRFEINIDTLKSSMLDASYHLLRAADKTFKEGRFRRQK